MEKVKIVLDADVIQHFYKGELLSMLPNILPEYDFVLLDYVRDELHGEIRTQIDNQILLLKNITLLEFDPSGEMMREYARVFNDLKRGKGESACMVYCRFTNNVIGSSNLSDIHDYCEEFRVTFLTTMDFIYYAYRRGMITAEECRTFVEQVKARGSKLPDVDIEHYVPKCQI
jgi:hypothetical protein